MRGDDWAVGWYESNEDEIPKVGLQNESIEMSWRSDSASFRSGVVHLA